MTAHNAEKVRPYRRLDDAHLRLVAEVYLEAIEAGMPPQQAVRDTFGVPQGTAAGWVSKARHKLGQLPTAEDAQAHRYRADSCPPVVCPGCGGRMRHYLKSKHSDGDKERPPACPACGGYGLVAVAGGEDFIYCNDPWHWETAEQSDGRACGS